VPQRECCCAVATSDLKTCLAAKFVRSRKYIYLQYYHWSHECASTIYIVVYVYVYMYIHICIYIHTCMYIHIFAVLSLESRMRKYYIYRSICICIYVYTYVYIYIYLCIYIYLQYYHWSHECASTLYIVVYVYVYIYIYMFTHVYKYIYIYLYMHSSIQLGATQQQRYTHTLFLSHIRPLLYTLIPHLCVYI